MNPMDYTDRPFIVLGAPLNGVTFMGSLLSVCGVSIASSNISNFYAKTLKQAGMAEDGLHSVPYPEHVRNSLWDGEDALAHVSLDFPERHKRPEQPWGFADHRSLIFIQQWAEIFPKAVFVTVIRHPLAAAASLKMRGLKVNEGDSVHLWLEYFRQFGSLLYGHNNCKIFRYDRLVDDPYLLVNAFKMFHPSGDMAGWLPPDMAYSASAQLVDSTKRHVRETSNVLAPLVNTYWQRLSGSAIERT